MMSALITVFKREFSDGSGLPQELAHYCDEVLETNEAFVYSLRPGVLMEFLEILKNNNITYGTHFDSSDRFLQGKRIKKS